MTNQKCLFWLKSDTPPDISPMLRALGEEYPVREGRRSGEGLRLRFERIAAPGEFRVSWRGDEVVVQYAATSLAARALGCLWSNLAKPNQTYQETMFFKTLGLMPDCSRNAALTVPYFKKWLRRAALLGYNQAMLYTEDIYELPGEPYFGYMRGAYTETESREIDDYAAALGIEMVACIQTLGHLGHALKWPAYAKVKDTRGTLLTLVPETYQLIDKMLTHWSRVFRSRRVAIGMDEAVDIGKGRGSDRHGAAGPANELFFNHLNKVADLCEKHKLKPIVWSDMVFWVDTPERNFEEAYYDVNITPRAADSIRDRLPKNVELGYWDYTGDINAPSDPTPYVKRIEKHRAVGREPIMVSGCWAWSRFWHDQANLTGPRVAACVKACRQTAVKELLMTIWTGMDGVDLDSAWAGLAYSAELAFSETLSSQRLERRYQAIFGAEYKASVAGALEIWWANSRGISAPKIFWDDPLQGIFLRSLRPEISRRIERQYKKQAEVLAQWRGQREAGDMDYIRDLAEFLCLKVGLSRRFQAAYRNKSREKLRATLKEIPDVRQALDAVRRSFRRMWLRQFKPFGMEDLQIRHAGLMARFEEMETRLREFLDGEIDRIEEMDVPPLSFKE